MGHHRGMYAWTVLIQQIRHVERHPQQCRQTERESHYQQPHQQQLDR